MKVLKVYMEIFYVNFTTHQKFEKQIFISSCSPSFY